MRVPVVPALIAAVVLAAPVAAQEVASLACVPQRPDNIGNRLSPYDSVRFTVAGQPALLCYGRPSDRDRVIFGELVPFGELWRTGANEPTILHLSFPASIAGVDVEPGSYSIYTVPAAEGPWQVVVNASTSQWGHESRYPGVADQEVGRGTAPAEHPENHVETFTISAAPAGDGAVDLVLEWENMRARIPVEARSRR